MAQDKKNFQGGLNRDDDSRIAPNGDYHYAQNIRVLSSEGRNAMLVENIRGTLGKIYSEVHLREGSFDDTGTEFVVVGAYEDKPTSCVYYFVWNERDFHRILEYNITTDVISTVFRDTGSKFNNVLNLRNDVLVTGINKIDDLLYWTLDSTFVSTKSYAGKEGGRDEYKKRVEENNEPKFINVEKAKAGWKVYYNSGSFNSNPTSDYDIDTMYPYEFYSTNANVENGEESADSIGGWRKRKYIDVCSTRPHPPFYTFQTPIVNISGGAIVPQDADGNSLTSIPAGGTSLENISIEQVVSNSGLDLKYKKNDLYGFQWQFAYRYVYDDNQVGAYSEWSYMLPLPQYYENKLNKDYQNYYNQIRVWYHNGPADVNKIEIVARKLNFNFGVEEEGNQGKFYLIATLDNNYYNSSYTPNSATDYVSAGGPVGYSNVSTVNVPYIKSMTSGSPSTVTFSEGNEPPLGFLDFRNDGVITPVDPIQFEKLYDRVPLRAKAQEVIAANRIAYGNYVDGFDNVPVQYDLMPIYGSEFDPIGGTNETANGSGGNSISDTGTGGTSDAIYEWGGTNIDPALIEELGLTSDDFGSAPNMSWEFLPVYAAEDGYEGDRLAKNEEIRHGLCWNVDTVRGTVKYTFPTQLLSSQIINIKFKFRVKFRVKWRKECDLCDEDNTGPHFFPMGGWDNWDPYDYEYFGAQIDLKYSVGTSTSGELIDEITSDIQKIMEQTWTDKYDLAPFAGESPSNEGGQSVDPEADDYNPNSGTVKMNHLYKEDSNGNHTYLSTGSQAAAEMRMYAEKEGSNTLLIHFVPYGQRVALSGNDNMCNGGSTNNNDGNNEGTTNNDHRQCNGCGVYGATTESDGTPSGDNDLYMVRDHQDGCTGDACKKNHPPMIDTSGGFGGKTTNLHAWRDDDGDTYKDALSCGGGCGPIKNQEGCYDDSKWCGRNDAEGPHILHPSEGTNGFVATGGGFNVFGTNGGTWDPPTGVNIDTEEMINKALEAGCFKSGAWHRFGIVYYDHKGRNSMVALQEPSIADPSKGSSCYVKFPTERINKEDIDGIVTDGSGNPISLDSYGKKLPALIGWKIFNKPPAWAEYYHWTYARNTSVGKFLQLTIDRAYVNKGGKPGTSAVDAENDKRIYISLNTMDGRDWSYSEKNRSNVGEWAFAEGDRMRIITDRQGAIMTDPDTSIQAYYDFKLSDVATFPGRFDLDQRGAAGATVDGISDATVYSSDSPVGGTGDTQETKPGKFIILEDPKLTGYQVTDGQSDSDGEIKSWRSVMVEIYRPKKMKEDETSLYHEISERYDIINPGSQDRYHDGPRTNQSGTYTTNADGTEVTVTPASGIFYRGDVWYKKRYISKFDEGGNSLEHEFFCEDYFLNDFLNTCHNNIARPHLPSVYAKEMRRNATVTYSDVYQPDTQYNGLHSFPFSQRPYMDYDLSLGSIQEMVSRDTDLVIMQEDKVSKILVNKSIVSTPGGAQSIALNNSILAETAAPFTGNYGVCLNPESVVVYGKVVYFVDIKRGAVLRLANDGLTAISEYKMTDYFRDKMDQYQDILISEYPDKLNGPLKIIGGYDPRHGEYVITFPPIYRTKTSATYAEGDKLKQAKSMPNRTVENWNSKTDIWEKVYVPEKVVEKEIEKDMEEDRVDESKGRDFVTDKFRSVRIKSETLGFSEKANRWVSYYTYYPDFYCTLHRKFISFKWGKLFLHDEDANNHSMFHFDKMPNELRLDFAFNTDVSSVKSWQNVSVEGVDKQNIIPIIGKGITLTNSQATITGASTSFTENNLEAGDSVYYYTTATPPVLTLIGIIQSIDNDTQITMTSNWTGSTTTLQNTFIIPAKNSMYDTRFKTNINESQVNHRLGYNNTTLTAGSWVIREDVGSVRIPYGITNSVGGEYFGLGFGSIEDETNIIIGNAAVDGSGSDTGQQYANSGINSGDSLYYQNSGTETLLGTVHSMPTQTGVLINLSSGYDPTSSSGSITVDGTNATTYFSVGDRVCNGDKNIVGTITAVSSTSITLDKREVRLINNEALFNFDIIRLNANYTTGNVVNQFMYVKKTATIEGDRLKGHYMETELTKRTKDKVHIYAANANVSKSELSNK